MGKVHGIGDGGSQDNILPYPEFHPTLTLEIVSDVTDEPDETFTVSLGSPTGGAVIDAGAAAVEVTVTDDDATPAATLSGPATVTEGGAARYTVTLDRPSSVDVTVDWNVANGGAGRTAVATADFTGGTLPSGRVSIAAGDTTATFEVPVLDDGLEEPDTETFMVTLRDPSPSAPVARLELGAPTRVVDEDVAGGRSTPPHHQCHRGLELENPPRRPNPRALPQRRGSRQVDLSDAECHFSGVEALSPRVAHCQKPVRHHVRNPLPNGVTRYARAQNSE